MVLYGVVPFATHDLDSRSSQQGFIFDNVSDDWVGGSNPVLTYLDRVGCGHDRSSHTEVLFL